MLNEVGIPSQMGTFLFGHVLSMFCTGTPHSSIRVLGKHCPVHVLSWKLFITDNVYPALAKVVSKTNCEVRSGVFVDIDHDNEIIDKEGECNGISSESMGVGATAREFMVRSMLVVKREHEVLLIDVLVMGEMECLELWIRLDSLVVGEIEWYAVNAGSRVYYVDGDQIAPTMSTSQYNPEMVRRVGKGKDGQAHLDACIADSESAKLLGQRTRTPLQPCKSAVMYWIGRSLPGVKLDVPGIAEAPPFHVLH
ncbi:hypothetical protein EDD15DRAFT_2246275 [Pisolithus albus]|nr:hypothetical protein EDD15DRAFT_2246275 [Pisolithus albus]